MNAPNGRRKRRQTISLLEVRRDPSPDATPAAGERLTGWTEPAAIGRPLAEVLQTLDTASCRRRDALTTDEGSLHEYLLLDRAGKQRVLYDAQVKPAQVLHDLRALG